MINKIRDLTEKVSDKLLMGFITLDSFLDYSSVPLQEAGDKEKSQNYLLAICLLVAGTALGMKGESMRKHNKKFGWLVEGAGYATLVGILAYMIVRS